MSYQRKKKRVDISVEAGKVKAENLVVAIQFQRKTSHHGSFFDIKTAKIDGQTVSLYGIFDGFHVGELNEKSYLVRTCGKRKWFQTLCHPMTWICHCFCWVIWVSLH